MILLAFSALCGKTWTVCRCSPLFGFGEMLKGPPAAAAGIEVFRHFVTNSILAAASTTSTSTAALGAVQVKVDQVKGLRGHAEDADAFRIEVSLKTGIKTAAGCTVYMVSVDSRETDLMAAGAAQLPCVLTRGNPVLIEQVLMCLEKRFDCVVARQHLPEEDLKWISALWCGFEADSANAKGPSGGGSSGEGAILGGTGGSSGERATGETGGPWHEGAPGSRETWSDTVEFKFKISDARLNGCGVDSVSFSFDAAQIRFIWEK